MNFQQVWIVFQKEAIDNMRDRRSFLMALIYPFIGAMLLGLLITFVGNMFKPAPVQNTRVAQSSVADPSQSPMNLPVHGGQFAPDVLEYLKSRNITPTVSPPDPKFAVREGQADVILVIDPEYQKDIIEHRTTHMQLLMNATRLSTIMTVSRISNILKGYGSRISDQRLKEAGLSPEVAKPFAVQMVNVGRSKNLAGFFLNMLPPFIIFTIFVGGVYLAIDTTAGERERGSLEPLLTNPVKRGQLMLGKALAAFCFTMVAVIFQICAFKVMFQVVSSLQSGLTINPSITSFFLVLITTLPLIMLAVSIQFIVATIARSYKETQTYLALLPLIPSVPGMILVFVPINTLNWMMAIPTFGQTLIIGKLVRQEHVPLADYLVSGSTTVLLATALLYVANRLYHREQLLFGG